MKKKLARAVKQAQILSEQYPEYFHVMTKKFHKPSVVVGGWHRTYMRMNGWITYKIFCNGEEAQIIHSQSMINKEEPYIGKRDIRQLSE